MTLADLSPLANHLWQSTLFAIAIWVLTLALRKNRASARYWLWFAASGKFLIPFSLLVGIGSKFAWQSSPATTMPQFANVMNEISRSFVILADTPTSSAPLHASSALSFSLLAMWLCGGIVVLIFWLLTLRQVRAIKRAATTLPMGLPIPVMSLAARMEPGVFGIFNPVLILPEGITNRLTPAQFKAVLTHELCHVRRRDNLTAAIHMVVEVIFWFHPLVWWIRTQLVAERERSCDEAVVCAADDPQVYAEAILNVCKLYMESPLRCASGVSGSDLKRRIRAIATGRVGGELNFARKAVLVIAGMAALVVPISMGLMGATLIRGQSQAQSTATIGRGFKYEPFSIKLLRTNATPDFRGLVADLDPDGIRIRQVLLLGLLQSAYAEIDPSSTGFGLRDNQIIGAPNWATTYLYAIEGKMDPSVAIELGKLSPIQQNLARAHMLQEMLADRFKLKAHPENREGPVYYLVIAKKGPKLKLATPGETYPTSGFGGALPYHAGNVAMAQSEPGSTKRLGLGAPMERLTETLSAWLHCPVIDKTGLTGKYDFELQWTGREGAETGPETNWPSLFTAIQEQLGLKLESGKGPVSVLVIDHVEKASGN
jgi:uncharacterized protein (TIGR03435 family)